MAGIPIERCTTAPPASVRRAVMFGNAILLAWLIYFLVAPTIGFNWIESWHNEQRAVQVVLLVASAVTYVSMSAVLARAAHVTTAWSLPGLCTLLFVIGIASALRSPHVFAGLAEVSLYLLLTTLALLTATVVSFDPGRAYRWARWFAALFSWAYVLGVATRYFAALELGRSIDLDVLVLGYANPRFPSAFHTLLLPFLAASAADRSERPWMRGLAFAAASFLWSINLGLGTRGIWLAFALGLPGLALMLGWNHSKRLIAVVGLSCLVGICLYFVLLRGVPVLSGGGSAVSSPVENVSTVTKRDVLWQLSWGAIQSSPVLGIGPMQFAAFGSEVGAHPHNWVLQVASEWGLIALAVVLWGLYLLARAFRRSHSGAEIAAPALSVATALGLGLVDGNLVMPVSQTGFFLALGLLIGMLHRHDATADAAKPARLRLTIAAAPAVAAVAVVASYSVATFYEQPSAISHFRKAYPGAWLVPRFWEQGSL